MRSTRNIIQIDHELCNGCGRCIIACTEGALVLSGGKAHLAGEFLCDGLGACIGECPTGALTIVRREAEGFDEKAVRAGDQGSVRPDLMILACGCPSSEAITLQHATHGKPEGGIPARPSRLAHWPVKLRLLGAGTPFLRGSDLILIADCCALVSPDIHERFLNGKAVAIACPKFDDTDAHTSRLADILSGAKPVSLTVAHMDVPCCTALARVAADAARIARIDIPVRRIVLGRKGDTLLEEEIPLENTQRHHV